MAKNTSQPDISLLRKNLVPEAFAPMTASRLPFAYDPAVKEFNRAITPPGESRTPPSGG